MLNVLKDSHPANHFTCSKLIIETLEQGVKYDDKGVKCDIPMASLWCLYC